MLLIVNFQELYNSATVKLSGPIDFRHSYVDMTNVQVNRKDGSKVKTCKPAMGYSFAAGTTDGPGAFDFKQGDNSVNYFHILDLLSKCLSTNTVKWVVFAGLLFSLYSRFADGTRFQHPTNYL